MPTPQDNEARIIILETAVLRLEDAVSEVTKQSLIRDAQLNETTSKLLDTRNRLQETRYAANLDTRPAPTPPPMT